MKDVVSYYRNLLAPFFRGKKIVLAAGLPLGESVAIARTLKQLGAERCFLLANGRSAAGDMPDADDAWAVIEPRDGSHVKVFQGYREALRSLPEAIANQLAEFDPDGDAIVLTHSLYPIAEVAGREVFAPQRQAWVRWEDKTRVDDLFDRVGLRRAPSRIVPAADEAELSAAAQDLDEGNGTVWSGDSRDGLNGAASLVRWVRNRRDEQEAREFLSLRCDRIRVMPFLEGIPCSIHGMVFPGDVITFRPAEMLVLRHAKIGELFFAGSATYWDPTTADREAMRDAARQVGSFLWRHLGYRGVFTLDGILTKDGFIPTEINPRYGSAMTAITQALPELPLWLLDLVVRRGENLDYRATNLERALVEAADAHRFVVGWGFSHRRVAKPQRLGLRVTRGRVLPAERSSSAEAWLTVSPLGAASTVTIRPEAGKVPVGESFAPFVAMALRQADAKLGTSFGKLFPAQEVRREKFRLTRKVR